MNGLLSRTKSIQSLRVPVIQPLAEATRRCHFRLILRLFEQEQRSCGHVEGKMNPENIFRTQDKNELAEDPRSASERR